MCPGDWIEDIFECTVLSEHFLNLSDHLPILAKIAITLVNPLVSSVNRSEDPVAYRPNWKRCTSDQVSSFKFV